MKKVTAAVFMVGAGLLIGPRTSAQTAAPQENTQHVISDQDLDLLRKDLRSQRKQLIAANLKLTDDEATKFWPVYDQYVSELISINDRKFALIQEYADNFGKLTNEQALSFVRRWLDADVSNLFPIRSAHSNDDRTAAVVADALGTGAVIGQRTGNR